MKLILNQLIYKKTKNADHIRNFKAANFFIKIIYLIVLIQFLFLLSRVIYQVKNFLKSIEEFGLPIRNKKLMILFLRVFDLITKAFAFIPF